MAVEEPTVEYPSICGAEDPGFTYRCGHPLFHDGDHSWEPGQELGISVLIPKPPRSIEETHKMDANEAGIDPTREKAWEQILYNMQDLLGFRISPEEEAHLKVLIRALHKYHVRDAQHRGLWRYFGAIDSAFQGRAKATRTYNNAIFLLRLGQEEWPKDFDPFDDAIDMINYGAFFLRSIDEGNYGG